MTEQKNLFAKSVGMLRRNFAEKQMIRTAPNLDPQNAKHEKHSKIQTGTELELIPTSVSILNPINNRIYINVPLSFEIIKRNLLKTK